MIRQTPTAGDVSGAVSRLLAAFDVPVAGIVGSTITFVVALLAVYLLARLVVLPVFERVTDSRELDAHVQRPLRRLLWGVVLFVGVAVAFGFAGYENFLTSLATIAAAATLALGLAMQDVLRNFVAGVFIFTERPFRIGDWIEWDGNAGVVEDINPRVTRVRTFDNELLTVPNANLTDEVVKNPVAHDRLRMKFTFGIGYGDDVERASDIVVRAARDHPEILDNPAPTVRLTELGDNDVRLQSRFWIGDPSRSDFVRIRGEYVREVTSRFDEAGIDIPYPQRVLHGGVAISDGDGSAALGAERAAGGED